jgi:hypothetical protein
MVSVIALKKYEPAALSYLSRLNICCHRCDKFCEACEGIEGNFLFHELGAWCSSRAVGVWSVFFEVARKPDWTKSSHRRFGFGRKESRSILQERQGNEISA